MPSTPAAFRRSATQHAPSDGSDASPGGNAATPHAGRGSGKVRKARRASASPLVGSQGKLATKRPAPVRYADIMPYEGEVRARPKTGHFSSKRRDVTPRGQTTAPRTAPLAWRSPSSERKPRRGASVSPDALRRGGGARSGAGASPAAHGQGNVFSRTYSAARSRTPRNPPKIQAGRAPTGTTRTMSTPKHIRTSATQPSPGLSRTYSSTKSRPKRCDPPQALSSLLQRPARSEQHVSPGLSFARQRSQSTTFRTRSRKADIAQRYGHRAPSQTAKTMFSREETLRSPMARYGSYTFSGPSSPLLKRADPLVVQRLESLDGYCRRQRLQNAMDRRVKRHMDVNHVNHANSNGRAVSQSTATLPYTITPSTSPVASHSRKHFTRSTTGSPPGDVRPKPASVSPPPLDAPARGGARNAPSSDKAVFSSPTAPKSMPPVSIAQLQESPLLRPREEHMHLQLLLLCGPMQNEWLVVHKHSRAARNLTRIPHGESDESTGRDAIEADDELSRHMIGQQAAVETCCASERLARAAVADGERDARRALDDGSSCEREQLGAFLNARGVLLADEAAARDSVDGDAAGGIASLLTTFRDGVSFLEVAGLAYAQPAAPEAPAGAPSADTHASGDHVLVVMRHSIREDTNGWANVPLARWPDKTERPFDPPISDHQLPANVAQHLVEYNISTIVSSPFRRCLQTAGIVARELGVGTVHIDDRLGEWFREVQRCFQGAGIPFKPPRPLADGEVKKALGDGVVQGRWEQRAIDETDNSRLLQRVQEAVPHIASQYPADNILLVTHGDIANRYLPEAEYIEEYSYMKLHEAGFVALRPPHKKRAVEADIIGKHRVEVM